MRRTNSSTPCADSPTLVDEPRRQEGGGLELLVRDAHAELMDLHRDAVGNRQLDWRVGAVLHNLQQRAGVRSDAKVARERSDAKGVCWQRERREERAGG